MAGDAITDTIGSVPAQGLVAQVLAAGGKGEPGVVVDFESPVDLASQWYSTSRLMLSSGGTDFLSATAATTDTVGRAVVRARFGTVAGPAVVVVTVPLYGLVDTAHFTIAPGMPVGVRVTPGDTAVEVGHTFAAQGGTVDRAGNVRSDAVTYAASSSLIQVNGSGTVSGVSVGRAYLRVSGSAGGKTVVDSGGVSVVPVGRVVYEAGYHGPLSIANLDGSNPRVVLSYYAGAGAWSPARDLIAFCNDQGVGVTDTLGNARMLAPSDACWPQFSPDGQWIYYHAAYRIRRIHPDGTGMDTLFAGQFPTASPDGARLAFVAGGPLAIGDIATGTVVNVPNSPTGIETPRWSPDGQMIAYVAGFGGGVGVVRPDGTLVRSFSGSFDTGLGWSPDSRFIVACTTGGKLILLDVVSGSILPLPTSGLYPNWTP